MYLLFDPCQSASSAVTFSDSAVSAIPRDYDVPGPAGFAGCGDYMRFRRSHLSPIESELKLAYPVFSLPLLGNLPC